MIRSILLILAVSAPVTGAAQSLQQRLQQLPSGHWLSYDVPLQPGLQAPCCFESRGKGDQGGVCRLDQRDWSFGSRDDAPPPAPGSKLRVLLRRGAAGFD